MLLVPALRAILFNFLLVSSGVYIHFSRYIVQLLFLAYFTFADVYFLTVYEGLLSPVAVGLALCAYFLWFSEASGFEFSLVLRSYDRLQS